MRTFLHSGDMGDIIYALSAMKAVGGGKLFLDVSGGADRSVVQIPRGRTKFNDAAFEFMLPLLVDQTYISEVARWAGEDVDHDLDRFREHACEKVNIADMHMRVVGCLPNDVADPWLRSDPTPIAKVVVSRSLRYHGNYSFWESFTRRDHDWVFVGTPFEHQVFETVFETRVPYFDVPTAYELARVIAGAELFVGNQNLCRAVAEGLKKNVIVEEYPRVPNTRFVREGAVYV